MPSIAPTPESARIGKHAWSQSYCRQGAILILADDASRIVIVPVTCKLWHCPKCGPRLRDLWAERISLARPRRFLTLTCDPARFAGPAAAYQAMKLAIPRLVAILRKKIGPLEYCAVWELHESGWPHLHLAQRGVYIPQAFLSAVWNRLGIGPVVDIRAVNSVRGTARYVSKYITKTITEGKASLRLTKVIQHSRGFFPKDLLFHAKTIHPGSGTIYTRAHVPKILDYLVRVSHYRWAADVPGYAYTLVPGPDTHPITDPAYFLALDHL